MGNSVGTSNIDLVEKEIKDFYALEIDVSGFSGLQAALGSAGLGKKISDFQKIFYDTVYLYLSRHRLGLKIISPPNGDAVILGVPKFYTKTPEHLRFLSTRLHALSSKIQENFRAYLDTLNVSGHSFTGQCTFHLAEGSLYQIHIDEMKIHENVVGMDGQNIQTADEILSILDGTSLERAKNKGASGMLKYTKLNGEAEVYPLEEPKVLDSNMFELGLPQEIAKIREDVSFHVNDAISESAEFFRDQSATVAVKLPEDLSQRREKYKKFGAFIAQSHSRYKSIKLSSPKVDIPYAFFRMEIMGSDSKQILEDLTLFIQDARAAGLPVAVTYSPLTMQTYVSGGRGYDPASPALSDGARLLSKFKDGQYGVILAQSFLDRILPGMEWQAQSFKGVGELRYWSRLFAEIDDTFNLEDALARKMSFSEKDLEMKLKLKEALKAESASSAEKKPLYLQTKESGNGASAMARLLYREFLLDKEDPLDIWMVQERDAGDFLAKLTSHPWDSAKNPCIFIEAELWGQLMESDRKGVLNLHPKMKILVVGRGSAEAEGVFELDESLEKMQAILAQACADKQKSQADNLLKTGLVALKDALPKQDLTLTIRYLIRFVLPELEFTSDGQWNYGPLLELEKITKNKKSILQTNFSLQGLEKGKFKSRGQAEGMVLYGRPDLIGLKWLAMFAKSGVWCGKAEIEARLFNGESDDEFKKDVFGLFEERHGKYRIKEEFQEGAMYLSDADVNSEAFKREYRDAFKVCGIMPLVRREEWMNDETGLMNLNFLIQMDAREIFSKIDFLLEAAKLSLEILDTVSIVFRRKKDIPSLRKLQRKMIAYIESQAVPKSNSSSVGEEDTTDKMVPAFPLQEWRMRALWLMIESYDTDAQKKYYQEWDVEGMLSGVLSQEKYKYWKVFFVISLLSSEVIPNDCVASHFTGNVSLKLNGNQLAIDGCEYTFLNGLCTLEDIPPASIYFYSHIIRLIPGYLDDYIAAHAIFANSAGIRIEYREDTETKFLNGLRKCQYLDVSLIDFFRVRFNNKRNSFVESRNFQDELAMAKIKFEISFASIFSPQFKKYAYGVYQGRHVEPVEFELNDDQLRDFSECIRGLIPLQDRLKNEGLIFHAKLQSVVYPQVNNNYLFLYIYYKNFKKDFEKAEAVYQEYCDIVRQHYSYVAADKITLISFYNKNK